MRKYLSILVMVALLFGLYGCVVTESEEGQLVEFYKTQAKKTKITVWMDDTNSIYMPDLIADFETKNPDIEVVFQHKGTVQSRADLKTYGQSGYGADVFQFPHDHMAQAILDDLVAVLPDDLKLRLEDRVLPIAMDIASACYAADTKNFSCDIEGAVEKLFAVPISIESIGIYYNRALITDEEAQSITTFETLLQKSAEWRAVEGHGRFFASSSHWADAYYLQPFFSAFGWTPFGPNLDDATAVGFADPELQATINWMLQNLKPEATGNANTDSVAGSARFQEGTLPLIIGGPWNIPDYRKANVDFGAIKIPTINGQATNTFAGAQMVAVYKGSKNPAAAYKFVEYLTSDSAAAIIFEKYQHVPALKEEFLANVPGISDDPIVSVMLEQLKTSVPMPTIPEVTYYWGPAQSMMQSVWNSAGVVATEVVNAESAYVAARDLAKGK